MTTTTLFLWGRASFETRYAASVARARPMHQRAGEDAHNRPGTTQTNHGTNGTTRSRLAASRHRTVAGSTQVHRTTTSGTPSTTRRPVIAVS
jgi:hypothetical protein